MIRTTLLFGVIAFGCGYSFVNWFRSALILIVLMGVYQHPDMPRSLLGIPGMNPWNLLLMFVCIGWLTTRGREGFAWDFPKGTLFMLVLYATMLLVSAARAISDPTILQWTVGDYDSMGAIVGDFIVNTLKWMLLPVLMFDGCRDERRLKEALWCTLFVYVFIALQVVKYMPPQYAVNGDELQYRAIRVLEKGVGYHRVNLSVMFAGASWALFATRLLVKKRSTHWLISITSVMIVYAQAMTAGRAGYLTWGLVGLTLCTLKWRRYLLAVPLVVAGIVLFAPAVSQRMLAGFSDDSKDSNALVTQYQQEEGTQAVNADGDENSSVDAYTVTAGRSFMWPFVLAKIQESPWIGHGRVAMLRLGITKELAERYGEIFGHPHNAYLELLLDMGYLGAVCILPFYVVMTWRSLVLFMDSRSNVFVAAGGACLAVMLALLYGAVGSQSFYPTEGWVEMWCLMGVMLRVHVQRQRMPADVLARATAARLRAAPVPVAVRPRPGIAAAAMAPVAAAAAVLNLDEALWMPVANTRTRTGARSRPQQDFAATRKAELSRAGGGLVSASPRIAQ